FKASPGGEGQNDCYGYKHTPDWSYEVPSIKDDETGETQVSKIESSPAAAGSRVFFGANNGNVYAVDSATGQLIWERKAGDDKRPVTSSPAVANGIVVIGSQDKNVYWLGASDGKVLKTFATESAILTSPAIDGNHAFAASQNGVLYDFGPEIPTRADLVVSTIQGADTTLQVTLKNQGDRAAGNTTVRLFAADTFLANVAVPALGPGNSTTVTYTATQTGSIAIRAVVDPDNAVAESNDSNNELTTAVSLGVVSTAPVASDGDKKDGGGFKIPGLGLVPTLAMLGLAMLALRRRR
ncbi:MAG TPA: PQQ-binding-like beta-propeller repeat protein, partial [Candidatus Thermoplasmatota archaeon]|nr:PQQ-binding-like beta-propeller repeat protein [Candidatus Thermoplasmatota archaeon]